MGVAQLREAFNEVTGPRFTCDRALLGYERGNDTEWQRLIFRGTSAAGGEFEIRSDRLRPGTDVIAAAREVAQRLLDKPVESLQ